MSPEQGAIPQRFAAYLRTRGREDLAAGRDLFLRSSAGPEGVLTTLLDERPVPAQDSKGPDPLLAHKDPRVRAAGLWFLHNSAQGGLIPAFIVQAFDDADSSVRGAALWGLLCLAAGERFSAQVESWLNTFLVRRFGIVDPEVFGQPLARVWLESLAYESDRHEREARRLAHRETRLQNLAGANIDRMRRDTRFTLDLLDSEDPNLRTAALTLLRETERSAEFRDKCEQLCAHDSDLRVRIGALSCLIACYTKTRNERILGNMARLVLDNTCSQYLREIAYQGIFQVNDAPPATWPEVRAAQGLFRFPDDVDWEFVAQFTQGNRED